MASRPRLRRTRLPTPASASPSSPPSAARSRLSTKSWRTSRRRPDPSAARIANSWTRPVARTSTRLATLTHATSSTSATAISSRCSGPREVATRSSCSGSATMALLRVGRPAFLHRPAQGRELRSRLLEADPVSQPADRGQRVVLLVGVAREGVWEPRIHFAGDRIVEARRRNSRHLVWLRAQLNGRADDRRVAAKARPPDRSLSTTRRVPTSSSRSNPAAAQRTRSQRAEVVARDLQHAEPLGLPVPDQVEASSRSSCRAPRHPRTTPHDREAP